MQVVIGRHSDLRPALFCLQGGGALGGFSVGALEELVAHFFPVGAIGTSSGGLSADSFIVNWIEGFEAGSFQTAAEYAIAGVNRTWQNLRRHLGADNYLTAALSLTQVCIEQISPVKPEAPLLSFYRATEGTSHVVMPSRKLHHPFCATNTTLVSSEHSAWESPPESECVHIHDGLTPSQKHRIIAAGGCLDFSRPVEINGEFHWDGAFSNPFPDPLGMAEWCVRNDVTMVILRTRPTEAYDLSHYAKGTDDWKRAYFNTKMDTAIASIKSQFPNLDLCVIEPDKPAYQSYLFMAPEICFDKISFERLKAEGRGVTARLMQQSGRSPLYRPSSAPPQPARANGASHALLSTASASLLPACVMAHMTNALLSSLRPRSEPKTASLH